MKKIILYLSVVLIAATSFSIRADAIEINPELNDILFYDPNAAACSPVSGLVGSDVAEQVYNFLISESFAINDNAPLTPAQASGILGNFQMESSMDPTAVNPSSRASGLAQWLGSRFTALEAYAREQNKTWEDVEAQLGYLKVEMDGSELRGLVNRGFADVTTASEAAVVWVHAFERPGAHEIAAERRSGYAEEFFQRFSGQTARGGSSSSHCPSGGPTGDFMDDSSFVSFSQCSNPANGGGPWGSTTVIGGRTHCELGCGPTSATMVIRNMTGQDITPSDAQRYYSQNGFWTYSGSSPGNMRQIAEEYGLRAEQISPSDLNLSKFREMFDNGGLIVIGGLGPEPFYTNIGHYVVVRGITEDGKFRISDPGRGKVADYDTTQIFASVSKRQNNATVFYNN